MKTGILKGLTAVLLCCLFNISAFPQSAVVSTDLGTPTNLIAIAVSDSEIRLSWESSSGDQENLSYQIKRNGALISTSIESTYTDEGLSRSTFYTYEIVSSDGVNVSKPASYSLATLNQGDTITPTVRPLVSDTNVVSDSTTGPDTSLTTPDNNTIGFSSTAPAGYTQLIFNDDFDGSGDLDVTSASRNWRFETMDDGLHRAGNTGIDADGNLISMFNSVRGKRWSAWYNEFNNTNTYRSNGVLVVQGTDSGILDPTRPVDYLDNGTRTTFGASKLYTSWIDTFSRVFDIDLGEHVKDPDSPGKSFRYGYVEASVSFEQMSTPGFRLSLWLMPASSDAEGTQLLMTQAYDADGNNGVEIDIFEYEWVNAANASRIQAALVGGAAGSISVSRDVSTLPVPIDLSQGFHTVGLLWEADKLEWQVNGQTIQAITDEDIIPDIYSYLILSREMNSGVKRQGVDSAINTDMLEQLPFIPRDPGLFANNVWEFRERIVNDKARVDYIRVWQQP